MLSLVSFMKMALHHIVLQAQLFNNVNEFHLCLCQWTLGSNILEPNCTRINILTGIIITIKDLYSEMTISKVQRLWYFNMPMRS